jgi:hypothetical protein
MQPLDPPYGPCIQILLNIPIIFNELQFHVVDKLHSRTFPYPESILHPRFPATAKPPQVETVVSNQRNRKNANRTL